MTPQPSQVRTPSKLPVIALVFSVLGFCLPPLLLVGVVLGIVALAQAKGSQAPAIVAVVQGLWRLPAEGWLDNRPAIPNLALAGHEC